MSLQLPQSKSRSIGMHRAELRSSKNKILEKLLRDSVAAIILISRSRNFKLAPIIRNQLLSDPSLGTPLAISQLQRQEKSISLNLTKLIIFQTAQRRALMLNQHLNKSLIQKPSARPKILADSALTKDQAKTRRSNSRDLLLRNQEIDSGQAQPKKKSTAD